MAEAIQIEIPAVEESQLGKYLQDNQGLYRSALDLTANPYDPYSQIDQVDVTSVHVEDGSITIEYRVIYSAFHACHDRSFTDISSRRITAKRVGRVVTFIPFEPLEERSTDDEL